MAAKYLMNQAILDLLDDAMVRANLLHARQEIPLSPTEYRQQTYALQQSLREALGRIQRFGHCEKGAMSAEITLRAAEQHGLCQHTTDPLQVRALCGACQADDAAKREG